MEAAQGRRKIEAGIKIEIEIKIKIKIKTKTKTKTKESGGWVWYDYQRTRLPDGRHKFLRTAQPWAPGWLTRSVGDEYFHDVIRVSLLDRGGPDQSASMSFDEVAGFVKQHDRLETLSLNETPITDLGFARIGLAAGLEDLAIDLPRQEESKVTAVGLASLGKLTGLRRLSISGFTLPEDVPMAWTFLARLTHLESLNVTDSTVDRAVLSQLPGLTQLRRLALAGVCPGDADVARLAGLSQLESVSFDGHGITDLGLARLAKLKSLRGLGQPGANQLTDAGLAHLSGLARLERLDL